MNKRTRERSSFIILERLIFQAAPKVDKATYQKYDTPAPVSLSYYVLFQYVLCLIGTALFLFKQADFQLIEKVFFTVIISIVVVNCGVLFENKPWVKWAEWLRIVIYPLLLIVFTTNFWQTSVIIP